MAGFADDENSPSFSDFDVSIVDPEGHERRRWRAFANRVAESEPFEQIRTWPSKDDELLPFQHLSRHVLQSFRPNDTIQLLPLARFGGWRNCTHSASISITGRQALERSLNSIEEASPASFARSVETTAPSAVHNLYEPLRQDLREIRLLHVLPGQPGSGIECTLQQISLSETTETHYEALSYCWGDAREKRDIMISGRPMSIVINLYEALQRLRRVDEPRTVWIDAVCINQYDTAERAWQVQEMRNIYSRASRVIVWLGEQETTLWPSCVKDIRSILDQNKDVTESQRPPSLPGVAPVTEVELQDNLPELHTAHTLLENPWFTRVWVLQEVFHARSVQVLLGDQTCSWELIMQINTHSQRHRFWLRDYQKAMPALFSELFPLTRADDDKPGYFGYSSRKPQVDILDVMVAGLDLDASDPRDKLFALLPFTDEFDEPALKPNYDREPALVFRDFTLWWIRSRRSLRILSAVHCSIGRTWQAWNPGLTRERDPSRPSWSLWYDGKSAFGLATLGLASDCAYRASGDTEIDIELLDSASDDTLPVRGVIVAEIAMITRYPYFVTFLGSAPQLEPFRHVYELLFDVNNNATIYSAGSQARYGFYSDEEESKRESKTMDHFYAHEQYSRAQGAFACHSHSFFATTDGKLGLCPQEARPGDIVTVLYGGNVPYLLRRRDRGSAARFTFVGECFMPEFMNGEAMSADLESQVFELV